MTSWANTLGASDRQICWYVVIDGFGLGMGSGDLATEGVDSDGRIRFAVRSPGFAGSSTDPLVASLWKQCLAKLPDVLSERAPIGGGSAESGEVSLEVVETDGWFSDLARLLGGAVTQMASGASVTTTSLVVGSAASLAEEDVVWLDNEACLVTGISGATLTVTRGWLGTKPGAHEAGAQVFKYVPYLVDRKMTLYAVPYDGVPGDEVEMGQYVCDTLAYNTANGLWTIRGRSHIASLDQEVPSIDHAVRVHAAPEEPPLRWVVHGVGANGIPTLEWRYWTGSQAHPTDFFFCMADEEVLSANHALSVIRPQRRGLCGTKSGEPKAGDVIRRVLVADPVSGDFRFSVGQEEDRTAADWTVSSHWIDILLCLLTSSAAEDDGLELVNYTGANPNYSCLPVGFGLGLKASEIDWESFLAAKASTLDHLFPWFVLGREREPFRALVDREFLSVVGAYLYTENGLLKVHVGGLANVTRLPVDVNTTNLMVRGGASAGVYEPDMDLAINQHDILRRIDIEIGGPENHLTVSYRNAGAVPVAARTVTLEAAGVDPSISNFLDSIGSRQLFRWSRPQFDFSARVDLSVGYETPIGSTIAVTVPELPNLDGTSGWTDRLLTVTERELDPSDATYQIRAIGYGVEAQILRIAPAGRITGVVSNVATIGANTYTETNANVLGLPVTDAAAFTEGDVVRLQNLDGTSASGTTQTISDITGNAITLDGDFGGALASGKVLVFALYSESVAQQTLEWAYETDRDSPRASPSVYGDL